MSSLSWTGAVQCRDQLLGGWIGRAVKGMSCAASLLVAAAFFLHVFGPRQIVTAVSSAHIRMLLAAVGLGAVIQLVRAQRSRSLLAQHRPVALFHSFAAMVVGHGVGDLVPLAPGGPVLRSVLTERLTGLPVAFSGGVYVVEGMLDIIVPALLIPYVLLALPLPSWTHWLLIGNAAQAALLLVLLAMLATRARIHPGRWTRLLSHPRLMHLTHQVTDGLRALTAGGPRKALFVVSISFLLIVLTAGQLTLFLHAFDLRVSLSDLFLLLVLTLSAGSVPVKIPAFGTLSAAAVLPAAGIRGPEVGGYLLVSQFVLSSEAVVLAALVLCWWFARGKWPLRRVNRHPRVPVSRYP